MAELSERTRSHLARLFAPSDVQTAEELLTEYCSTCLPGMLHATPAALERIHFAALRVSEGRLEALLDAVALAQLDWRDLLVAAGFASDADAHLAWMPSRREAP